MLKRLLLLLLFSGFLTTSLRSAETVPDTDEYFRYGVTTSAFVGLNHNDAKAALKAWSQAILKEQQLDIEPELFLFDDLGELRESFIAGKLEAITLNVEQFLEMHLNLPYIFLPTRDNSLYISYSILVHQNGPIKKPADLKGRKIVSYTSADMVWARLWLQALVSQDTPKPVTADTLPVSGDENPSKALFQVYFRQADAALLPEDTYNLACELNPQLRREVMVLATSPPLITSVVVFRPSFTGTTRDKLESFLLEMHKDPHGHQLLTTFKRSNMERHPISILEETRKELIKYRQLERIANSSGSAN